MLINDDDEERAVARYLFVNKTTSLSSMSVANQMK